MFVIFEQVFFSKFLFIEKSRFELVMNTSTEIYT